MNFAEELYYKGYFVYYTNNHWFLSPNLAGNAEFFSVEIPHDKCTGHQEAAKNALKVIMSEDFKNLELAWKMK